LHRGKVEIVPAEDQKCEELSPKTENELNLICGMGRNVFPCESDAGGALVNADGVLAAIMSYGPKSCKEDNVPTVFTKILPYKEWLLNQIQDGECGSQEEHDDDEEEEEEEEGYLMHQKNDYISDESGY